MMQGMSTTVLLPITRAARRRPSTPPAVAIDSDMTFRAAFWIGKSSLFGAGIRLVKGYGITHAELVFSDGMAGTSDALRGGVCLYKFDPAPGDWLYVAIPGQYEAKAREWFHDHQGSQYDWAGIVLAQLLGTNWQARGKRFCSESCIESLQYAGFVPRSVCAYKMAPHPMCRWLIDAGQPVVGPPGRYDSV